MQSALLCTVLALIGSASALFEEQAGFLDWHKENIGSVTHAQFAFRGREKVFVATASSVIASLDTKDGSIAWRQVNAHLLVKQQPCTGVNLRIYSQASAAAVCSKNSSLVPTHVRK